MLVVNHCLCPGNIKQKAMEGRVGGRERGRKQWRTAVHYSLIKKKVKNYLIDFSQEVLETEM